VRTPHDVDPFANMRREARRIARDHPDRLLTTKDVFKNLVADGAGGSGNDDHV
jgi:hypothetical protein